MVEYIVTTFLDEEYNTTDDTIVDGDGLSLREALGLAQANGAATADTIKFHADLIGETITLTPGQELTIDSDVTIIGDIDSDGISDITIDADGNSRVINVAAGNAILEWLTITGGSDTDGAGIWIDSSADLVVRYSTIADNAASASGDGGGIYNAGDLTLLNVTVNNNRAGEGAGIYNAGNAEITNTTFYANDGVFGVGGFHNQGTAALTNVTLSGNDAVGASGTGAIVNNGTATLANSIAAGNGLAEIGGSGTTTLLGGNIVGDTLTQDSLTVTTGIQLSDIFANIVVVPSAGIDAGELADNGGPVQTIALNIDPANPALDSGDPNLLDEFQPGVGDLDGDGNEDRAIEFDARFQLRDPDQDGVIEDPDLGAFEVQSFTRLVVTTLEDSGDDLTVAGDVVSETLDGDGLSLREALILADAVDGADIVFESGLSGSIILAPTQQLEINSDVSIDGDTDGDNIADITIDAGGFSRVLEIASGTNPLDGLMVTLDALTITGGVSSDAGGGIRVGNYANLALQNAEITGNEANGGGGLDINLGATVVATNSTIAHNVAASGSGGGLLVGTDATFRANSTTLSDNSAPSEGGAVVAASGAVLALTDSTVSGNFAGATGGAFVVDDNTDITLTNTTVHGNSAGISGGAFTLAGDAIALTLTNATLSGNSAGDDGGVLFDASTNSTATIANSIVAGNAADTNDDFALGTLAVTYAGGNIIGDELTTDGVSDQTGIVLSDIFASVVSLDPDGPVAAFDTGQLADNGGPVETVALRANIDNPALEAGDATLLDETEAAVGDLNGDGDELDTVETDARGFERDVDYDGIGGTPDLGAFEAQAVEALIVTTLLDTGDDFTVTGDIAAEMLDGGGLSLREALILANGAGGGQITFDVAITGGSALGVDDGGILLNGAQLEIDSNVSIDGDTDGDNVADITIDADGNSRVISVTGGDVTLDALIITGGDGGTSGGGVHIGGLSPTVSMSNLTVTGNRGDTGGGVSIVSFGASVAIDDSIIADNDGKFGGGIAVAAPLVTLTMNNSTVSGNRADFGGGIGNGAPTNVLTLIDSTVSENSADVHGGGVLSQGTDNVITLVDSTLSNNGTNGDGGGIQVSGVDNTVTLTNLTVHGNTATGDGGGIQMASTGLLTVTQSTISGNSAAANGGGLISAADTTIANTIIAGNDAIAADDVDLSGASSTTYTGGNIIGDELTVDGVSQQTGIALNDVFAAVVPVSAGDSATGVAFDASYLFDNGGAVKTVALNPDLANPALEAGDAALLNESVAGVDFNGDGDTDDMVDSDARGFLRDVDFDGVGGHTGPGSLRGSAWRDVCCHHAS